MLPREADAAQGLDALLGQKALAVSGRGLGHGHGQRPPVVVLRYGQRGEVAQGPGPLQGDVHVGELVLHGLEGPDGDAELLAHLGVPESHVEDALAGAQGLDRHRCSGLLQGPAQRPHDLLRPRWTEHAIGTDLRAVQGDRRVGAGGVEGRDGLGANGGLRDDEQPDAVGADRPLQPCGHHELVGRAAVQHPTLRPRERPGASPRPCHRGHVLRRPAASGLGDAQRARQPPGGHLGQEPEALALRRRLPHRRDELRHRGGERAGRDDAAQLLHQHGQLDVAQPQPSAVLRDGEPGPVEGDHLRPQRPGRRALLHHVPHEAHGALPRQHGAYGRPQLLLVVGELEVHGAPRCRDVRPDDHDVGVRIRERSRPPPP